MNGLCQQCQVYYPMPEDFGQGVSYACPKCQAILVPYPAPEASPATAGAPGAETADGTGAAGTGDAASWDALVPQAPPEAPDDITLITGVPDALKKTVPDGVQAPTGAGADGRIRVVWFHPHPSPEVAAARREMAEAEPERPAGAVASSPSPAPPTANGVGAGGAPEAAGTDPWVGSPKSPPPAGPGEGGGEADGQTTTFVLRGAGAGVSREELPLDLPKRAPPRPAEPEAPAPRRTQEPVPRHLKMTTAAPPVRRRRPVVLAVIGVLLLGGAAAAWFTVGPGAKGATHPAAKGGKAAPAPAKAAPAKPTPAKAAPAKAAPAKAAPATTPAKPAPPAKARVVHPAKARAAPPAKTRVVHPAKTRAVPPAKTRVVHPAKTRAVHPAKTRAVHPAKARAIHPAKARAIHPAAPKAAPAPPAKTTPAAVTTPAESPQVAALDEVRTGNFLFRQGKIDQAIQAYQKALHLDPRQGLAHRGLGVAYAKLGRAAAAAKEYKRYLALDPTAPDAAQVRAIVKAYYAQQPKGP